MIPIVKETLLFNSDRQSYLNSMVKTIPTTTTILKDFATLLEKIYVSPLALTKGEVFTLKDLAAFNPLMQKPLVHDFQRPNFKSYPNLGALLLLLRASGLSILRYKKGKAYLHIDEAGYEQWHKWTELERYTHLLVVWLARANLEMINEEMGRGFSNSHLSSWGETHIRLIGKHPYNNHVEQELLKYMPGYVNLALLEGFGFVDIKVGNSDFVKTKGWQIADIKATKLGEALLALVVQVLDPDDDEAFLELLYPSPRTYDLFAEQLSVVLPKVSDISHSENTFVAKRHIFDVYLHDAWRQISISAEDNLDTFARAILKAYEFDNDHLYRFLYKNRYGLSKSIYHPHMEERLVTTDVRVGDLAIGINQLFYFNFDFGDDWYFAIKLDSYIDPDNQNIATVLNSEGTAPEQYPNYGDDFYE